MPNITPGNTSTLHKPRLDKWLWAARFYKTRALAVDAIKGGRVSLNGQRSKPGHEVAAGDCIRLRQGHELKTIIVLGLSQRRGPASEAQQLYEETSESIERRSQERELRQLAGEQRPRGAGRPSKRDRRQIQRLIRGQT